MIYYDYHFYGMHLKWWFVWIITLISIFATLYKILGQRTKKDSPLSIIKKRFGAGIIPQEQYLKHKFIPKK